MNEPSVPADVWMPEVMAEDQGAVLSSPTPLIVADQPGVETTEAPESNLPPQQQIENLKGRLQAAERQGANLDIENKAGIRSDDSGQNAPRKPLAAAQFHQNRHFDNREIRRTACRYPWHYDGSNPTGNLDDGIRGRRPG
ncbi:MAG UNVERIFIED_CONTAM: hypothetical protein LVR18_48030 [Planctomycetaceae bacterium]